ncbi:hypothetical protein L0F63_001296 [Massospora cicadina]|nr:hypothetical protein L0F63_001296 [Massospora cicadina]
MDTRLYNTVDRRFEESLLELDSGPAVNDIHRRVNRRLEVGDEVGDVERRYKFPRLDLMAPPNADELLKEKLLPYQLRGVGGFSQVFQAIGLTGSLAGTKVAIKFIPKAKLTRESLHARVRQEAEIQAQLDHPNIVKYYGSFEDHGFIYLVLELCPYGNLLQYLKFRPDKRLPESEVRHIMIKLVDALLYLHRLNIVHRDIKCSNILIGDGFKVQLGDFGLAINLDSQNWELREICGTINYISPEVIERRPYTFSSDVWSLGCVLVALLTGSPPFEGSDRSKLAQRIINVEYELPSYVSPQAARLVREMLIKEPEKRIPLKALASKSFFNPVLPTHPLDVKYLSSQKLYLCRKFSDAFQRHRSFKEVGNPILAPGEDPQRRVLRREPFEHVSSHSTLTLLSSGRLVLCFKNEHCMTVFSPDGQELKLYDYSSRPFISDALIDSLKPLRSYTVTMLPEKYHRRYRYACLQIKKVQCETVKVEYVSKRAICRLMLNYPHPDFAMAFESGHRIVSLASKSKLLIASPPEPSPSGAHRREFDTRDTTCFNLSVDLHAPFLHFQECLKVCLQISKRIDTSNDKFEIPFYFDGRRLSSSGPNKDLLSLAPYQDYRIDGWCLQRASSEPGGLGPRYLQGVGWGCRQDDGDISLLFNDGYRLELYSSPGQVKVYYPQGIHPLARNSFISPVTCLWKSRSGWLI